MAQEVSDRLIAALELDGELVDRGAFTIDEDAARAKLAHYRLATPSDWACIVVEAARLHGATRVRVQASIETLQIDFDGEPLDGAAVFATAAEVEASEGSSSSSRQVALRKLAIAISTLFGHFGVAAVDLESASARVRVHADAPNQRSPGGGPLNRIRVLGLASSERELERLRERCRYSPMRVEVEHEPISVGMREWLVEQGGRGITAIEDQGQVIGYAGLPAPAGDPAIYLMTQGVAAEQLHAIGSGLAIVDVALAKDIGEGAVRRDAEFDRVLALVEATIGAIPANAGTARARARPRPRAESVAQFETETEAGMGLPTLLVGTALVLVGLFAAQCVTGL